MLSNGVPYGETRHDSLKIHEEKKIKVENRQNHRDTQSSFGIQIMHNPRTYGKTPSHSFPDLHPSPHLGSYRNDHHSRSEVFGSQRFDLKTPPGFVLEEGELIDGHVGAGGGIEDMENEMCDLQCNADQFLCSDGCFCIADHLRCGKKSRQFIDENKFLIETLPSDSHPDCGTKAEDEIGCELTQDEIEQIRIECEIKEGHAMCPNTYYCIKQQWFCGKIYFVSAFRNIVENDKFYV